MRARYFLFALLFLLFGFTFVSAWTGPTASPPGNNASAPINVGSTNQTKSANLGVNGLAVFGNTLLGGSAGSNAYLNFGATSGSGGYGFRDNNGAIQYANSGGSWTSFSSSTSQWTTVSGGTSIYFTGGYVGIGATSPSWPLTVNNGTNSWAEVVGWPPSANPGYGILVGTCATCYSQFQNNQGYYTEIANQYWGVYTNGYVGAAAFLYSSDARLKKNIQALTGNLGKVLALQPVSYNWIDPTSDASTQIGFIAQQVQQIVPEIVHTDPSTTLESIDYPKLTPLLVGSVQELNQKIASQQTQIDAQQQEIHTLEQEVQALQK